MKKIISILTILIITIFIGEYAETYNSQGEAIYNYDDVKNSLIRFHVLANSDSEEDQKLKLKVKDKIINYLYSYLKNSKSLEESRKILMEKENYVSELANKVIKENGYSYSVKTELGYENFPEKSYGSIILPQGKYEAFRIIIGKGEGHNWWCVMFPPLCFTDVTKGQVEEDKSKDELDKVIEDKKENLNKEELNNSEETKQEKESNDDNDIKQEDDIKKKDDNNEKESSNENKEREAEDLEKEENNDKIKVKFKVVEIFKDIF